MSKPRDFLYSDPPLIEVISEIRWQITPIAALPGASIDPHFEAFNTKFSDRMKNIGLKYVERVVPKEIPIELTSEIPIFRYRKAKEAWPLYQTGPGLFTANIVPPYNGWNEFKKFLDQGINHLYGSYPLPNEYLRIKRLELRYMDGFLVQSGPIKHYRKFLEERLGIQLHLPNFPDNEGAAAWLIGEIHIPLPDVDNSHGIITIKPGAITKNDEKEAAIMMELIIRKSEFSTSFQKRNVASWFNKGHTLLHNWFSYVCSDDLKRTFGEKMDIPS